MNTTKRYRLPISKLFKILNIDNIEYETPVLNAHNIKINSPSGYVRINAFVKKYHDTATYYLDNGHSLTCSTKHIVFQKGIPRIINNCSFIDTVDGETLITSVEHHCKNDVYDVSLDAPHQYITPNGVIHHNTTVAKILINQLDVQDADVLVANGSKEGRKIEWVDKLIAFCQTMPFGEFKIVLIDEADYMNLHSVQPALRNLMEEYSTSVRFILTCNYPNKIMPAIHSRVQHLHFEKIDKTEYTARVAEILINEGVEFDLDVLDSYVKAFYPDLRKCINTLELNSQTGTLLSAASSSSTSDYKIKMVDLFKQGKVIEARTLICSQVQPEEIDEIYRWLYNNLELFGDTQEQQDDAVLIIKDGLVNHALVADPEINLSATLIQLSRI